MATKKNEILLASEVEHLPAIRDVDDFPLMLPNNIGVKEVYNLTQESKPISELTGKNFKVTGVIPEIVDVNKYNEDDLKLGKVQLDDGDTGKEMVKRLRLTIVTNVGSYHSFSSTFNKALAKAINMFGKAYTDETFTIVSKTRGSGNDVRNYYVMTAV